MHVDPEHHLEPRRIGYKWFDAVITIAILLVSVSSLVVAIVHSRTLERMADANAKLVEANSWPFLYYETSNGQTILMSIVNEGVGPAKIESIEVKWAGRARADAVDFRQACCGFKPRTADVQYALIAGKVLRAGQSINVLGLPHTAADNSAWNSLQRQRLSRALSVNVCYCSVFDQCWLSDIARFSLKPREMDHCVAPAIAYRIPN